MNALDILEEYSKNALGSRTFTGPNKETYTDCKLVYNPDYGKPFELVVYIEFINNKEETRQFYLKDQLIELKNGRENLFEILKTFQGNVFKDRKFIDKKGKIYEELVFALGNSSQDLFMIKHERNDRDKQILYKEHLQNLEEVMD